MAPLSPAARYRRATAHLAGLPERQQVLALKFELFRALVAAAALEERMRELAAAGARAARERRASEDREQRLRAFAHTLFASLCRKAEALEALRWRHARELLELEVRLRGGGQVERPALAEAAS